MNQDNLYRIFVSSETMDHWQYEDLKQALKLRELVDKWIKEGLEAEAQIRPHPEHSCLNIFTIETLKQLLEESKK